MYIITGLGRCGTSILTKYLKEVGYGLGNNIHWHSEVRAGYELSTFYCLTDWLYQFIREGKKIDLDAKFRGTYWKDFTYREALQKVDDDERQGKVDVVKDPRITWHPDIIEAMYEARPDIKLLICHRDIQSIYNSRNSLPERYNDPKPRKILSDYQIDFAEFMTRVIKLGIPYKTFFFPDFLKDHEEFYFQLLEFGLPHKITKSKEVWGKIIDKELVNGRT